MLVVLISNSPLKVLSGTTSLREHGSRKAVECRLVPTDTEYSEIASIVCRRRGSRQLLAASFASIVAQIFAPRSQLKDSR